MSHIFLVVHTHHNIPRRSRPRVHDGRGREMDGSLEKNTSTNSSCTFTRSTLSSAHHGRGLINGHLVVVGGDRPAPLSLGRDVVVATPTVAVTVGAPLQEGAGCRGERPEEVRATAEAHAGKHVGGYNGFNGTVAYILRSGLLALASSYSTCLFQSLLLYY